MLHIQISNLSHKHKPQILYIIENIMGRIDGIIDDKVERKFRIKVVEKYGGKKGTLSVALEEAIEDWLKKK